jgi:two-component system response regulator AtoC
MIHAADLYQAFFNTVGDLIFVVDAAAKTIVEANTQAINATGYQAGELGGLAFDRLFRQQEGPSIFLEPIDEAKRSSRDELLLVKKDGKTVAVNVSTTWVKWNLTKYLFLIARESDATLTCGGCSAAESSDAAWSEQKDFPTIIGQSEKIRAVCRLIGAVAKSNATVLIQGESGTGKEIIANAIHVHSHRGLGPFVKVNCAALTETLLESELFGHVKGAFTGAICDRRGRFKQADGGTILLDEIGSMSLTGQAKLLRVLQEHEFEPVGSSVTIPVNVRVVASTNIDLEKATSEGKFREDLYYRLNVFSIPLPPLRERKEDIPLLVQHFLGQHSRALGTEIQAVAPQTQALLIEHDWHGNVRELENAMEHAVIVEKGPVILPSSLPMNLSKSHLAKDDSGFLTEMGLREKLTLLERQILLDTLLRAHGVKKHTAIMLGIDARNLPYLLRKHRVGSEFGPTSETWT